MDTAPLQPIVGTTGPPGCPEALWAARYELLGCGHTGRILRRRAVVALGKKRRCRLCVGQPGQHQAP